jgi:hypothetical protein
VLSTSIITHRPDDGGSKHLWNVGKPDYMAQQHRRQPSSRKTKQNPQDSRSPGRDSNLGLPEYEGVTTILPVCFMAKKYFCLCVTYTFCTF